MGMGRGRGWWRRGGCFAAAPCLRRALHDNHKGRRLVGDILVDGGVQSPLLFLSVPRALAFRAPTRGKDERLHICSRSASA